MATRQENEILAVVANDVKHIKGEVGEIKVKVTEINCGLRGTQIDVAALKERDENQGNCIVDLYNKYKEVKDSTWKLIGIGAAVGSVTTLVIGVGLFLLSRWGVL
jgi:ElaB/YqjD/DUF883 family membrane-anchored ribosome-binding protein